jgi:RNA polymerase sigma-70 factor (ECF subfamily)
MKRVFQALSSLWGVSDEQAMSRVKLEDDPQAFAVLVQRWQRPIQRLCARMLGDVHEGEDLAQETFARLFARRQQYEPTGKLSTFLWRMALNLCYDELRKQRRSGTIGGTPEDELGEELPGIEPAPDAQMVAAERAQAVRQALARLAEPYRVVVVLRHYEGLKYREIGQILDVPEGTVKSRMAEALTQLNTILSHNTEEGDVECKLTLSKRPQALAI